jgi:hypothetical protein
LGITDTVKLFFGIYRKREAEGGAARAARAAAARAQRNMPGDDGALTLMATASDTAEGLRQRMASPRVEAVPQRSPPKEKQQPTRHFEVQQIDLLSVDRVDAIAHTFQANLFLQLVLRNGGLDPDLSQPDAVFPIDKDTGKPTYRPSAKVRDESVSLPASPSLRLCMLTLPAVSCHVLAVVLG